ncbi:4Fe-4S dicluster domain-containing protein [Campylobacter hyointestinalis]|uniref:4Fe-4S dicluster domain-containing protein n=1 Tax=Campylobacter hyointestinalis TaxID=198 RepID=UPI0025564EDF|nr:4Fe-4S dicluster domain-containing protein [Campylobacter hyointestinalis]MDL2346654.1 4Fe-4S dicluster domain-containing protein [Campylobacter hyointestinalis]MDL2348735.1 4Fe-4S dicluster domain-containing protein [Campylobacter hyointestinalis]MDL2350139.1 4Fe-4S dicluster domain-containing protein [Campylobacter hyointestinalis]MDM1026312.1 4Fe-4S dicluster domain-containing protein [Campylobacter hyointestinalis]MDM1027486.1 4Fe-4S dicluster domain-containing protein [Campylobacter hy
MDRRSFFKFSAVAASSPLFATSNLEDKKIMSIIDLDLCDGCKNEPIPLCVKACKDKNEPNFPRPQNPIMPYFPQTKFEDYQNQKDNINRLTPYNWTFVESVKVGQKEIFIPRRCMHCDNPPCQKLCPFGVISKSDEGAVDIDKNFCFGGAKCRDACPWEIPQRQAGVGIYLKIAPKLAGGGVMYKCDMCADLLCKNEKPKCQISCPKNAIIFDKKERILERLKGEKREIYGLNENGGTSTVYISSVKFEDIDMAISQKYKDKQNKVGTPHMSRVDSPLRDSTTLATATLLAPIAGVISAGIAVYKARNKDEK